MEIVVLSGAEADLDEIYHQIGESAGERLLLTLDQNLELSRTFPRLAPQRLQAKVRRVKIGRTPFGLFYTIEGRRLMVVAVQDLRMDPSALARIIRGRL